MSIAITFLIGAIPILVLISICAISLYCFISERLHRHELKRHYNHPDKDMPLYNVGHCDEYSAGVFTW
jgi:hypothetical protein